MDLLIKGAKVVFADRVTLADIGVKEGKIAGIFAPNSGVQAAQILNATGLTVFPGVIDPHMHLGIYNDMATDFTADTKAAAIGGITSIVNYYRGKESYKESVPNLIEVGEKHSLIDFGFSLGLLTKQHVTEAAEYARDFGVTSYKFYRNYQGDVKRIFGVEDPLTLDSADMMFILRDFAKKSSRLSLCVHCEDMDLQRKVAAEVKSENAQDSLAYFARTSPDYAETVSVMQALYLNRLVDGNMYIVHMSAGSSVDFLATAPELKEKGVTVETCPHYLVLTENSPANLLAKVNPPIHTAQDSEKLWEGIRTGLITTLGSDNCPSNLDKKYSKGKDVWGTMPGFPGAGLILPVLISEGYHKRGIPLETVAKVSSQNTAQALNLPQKGGIRVGADADFAIVDLEWEREVTPEVFGSCDYTVYQGMKFKGWPRYTISRGAVIAQDGKITAESGRGRYLKRSL
ncbi:MAG: dihydroorotase [Desulfitobacteriaceae bacterium]